MPLIYTLLRQLLQAFILVAVAITLGGCTITIQKPANNATIALPATTKVAITGNASYTGLTVMVDGVDFTSRMVSTGPSSDEGDLSLAAGPHTVSASAQVYCWYCSGAKTQSTDTKSFVVSSGGTHICTLSGSEFTFNAKQIAAAQKPGRQKIAIRLKNGGVVLMIVDDAPGLQKIQMRVELDINPSNGVTSEKQIEAWQFCRLGPRVGLIEASIVGGLNIGTACDALTTANNYRSGCTNTQTMLLNQSTTSELWLRARGFVGNWYDAHAFDSSIWQAFGGRSVRFIWQAEPGQFQSCDEIFASYNGSDWWWGALGNCKSPGGTTDRTEIFNCAFAQVPAPDNQYSCLREKLRVSDQTRQGIDVVVAYNTPPTCEPLFAKYNGSAWWWGALGNCKSPGGTTDRTEIFNCAFAQVPAPDNQNSCLREKLRVTDQTRQGIDVVIDYNRR